LVTKAEEKAPITYGTVIALSDMAIGRCQPARRIPRMTVLNSGERLVENLGKANPRQPVSSQNGASIRTAGRSRKRLYQGPGFDAADMDAPSSRLRDTAASATATGTRNAARYHWIPTRQRNIRLSRSFSPPVRPATMNAAISAPIGKRKGPFNKKKLPHEKPYAMMKKMSSEFRCINEGFVSMM
jgi:hypothetical protein